MYGLGADVAAWNKLLDHSRNDGLSEVYTIMRRGHIKGWRKSRQLNLRSGSFPSPRAFDRAPWGKFDARVETFHVAASQLFSKCLHVYSHAKLQAAI